MLKFIVVQNVTLLTYTEHETSLGVMENALGDINPI